MKFTRNEAIARGQKYYTGVRPCKHCGSLEKYVKGQDCRPCNIKRNKHKLHNKKIIGKYKTKDKAEKRQKNWRKNNPIKYIRQWCINNHKDIMPENANKRKIQVIYIKCYIKTQRTGIPHEVDHIIPIQKGGIHHEDNLQILTAEQNRIKGTT